MGGVPRSIIGITRELAALDPERIDVTVVAARRPASVDGLAFRKSRAPRVPRLPNAMFAVQRPFVLRDYDVVHYMDSRPPVTFPLGPRLNAVTQHGFAPLMFSADYCLAPRPHGQRGADPSRRVGDADVHGLRVRARRAARACPARPRIGGRRAPRRRPRPLLPGRRPSRDDARRSRRGSASRAGTSSTCRTINARRTPRVWSRHSRRSHGTIRRRASSSPGEGAEASISSKS